MRTRNRFAALAVCCSTALIVACAPAENKMNDSAAGAVPTPAPATISLADVAGKWNVRAVPATGPDTTPTLSVITATADPAGWTMSLANRPAQVMRIRVDGDSIMSEVGPYESVRRPGVQVTTHGVMRLQGGNLVGTTVAHYNRPGPDSVLVLRTMGTRAP